MSSYGSIVLPKNVFKNVLPTIGSNFHIQNGRHKNSAESENTGNALVALFLYIVFQGQGHIMGQCHRSCQPSES